MNKAKKKLYSLSKLKKWLKTSVLALIYKLHVRSILDYACTIYDSTTSKFVSRDLLVESAQKAAARIVLGALRHTSCLKMYCFLGWETLTDRRKYMKLTLFFKLINNKCRSLFRSLAPQQVRHTYRVRNSNC